jgi:hypothetical protein
MAQVSLPGILKMGPMEKLDLSDLTGTSLKTSFTGSKRKILVVELIQMRPTSSQIILLTPLGNLYVVISLPSNRWTELEYSIQRKSSLSLQRERIVPGFMP